MFRYVKRLYWNIWLFYTTSAVYKSG